MKRSLFHLKLSHLFDNNFCFRIKIYLKTTLFWIFASLRPPKTNDNVHFIEINSNDFFFQGSLAASLSLKVFSFIALALSLFCLWQTIFITIFSSSSTLKGTKRSEKRLWLRSGHGKLLSEAFSYLKLSRLIPSPLNANFLTFSQIHTNRRKTLFFYIHETSRARISYSF